MNEALRISIYSQLVSVCIYIAVFFALYLVARFWTSHRVEAVRIWLAKSPLAPSALINRLMGNPQVEFNGRLLEPMIHSFSSVVPEQRGHFSLLPGGVWKIDVATAGVQTIDEQPLKPLTIYVAASVAIVEVEENLQEG